ncbi:hypothetical protein [Arhodomonas sp. SL1]|uniref:hypothetical protein n=1 Tax=Arhodomonas sp. SL1 TaxID=3425691 RepID=UPI003F880EBE
MTGVTLLAVLLALAAIWEARNATACLRRRRALRAGAHAGGTLACLAPLAVIALLAGQLYGWQRLTAEQAVAEVRVEAGAPGTWQVELARTDGTPTRTYTLAGDEWQLEARVLRWNDLGALLGLDTRFRLERLSSRYRDARTAGRTPPTVHQLAPGAGDPLARAGGRLLAALPLADTRYGNAVFLPLADGARFRVSMGRDGLIARPLNTVAQKLNE